MRWPGRLRLGDARLLHAARRGRAGLDRWTLPADVPGPDAGWPSEAPAVRTVFGGGESLPSSINPLFAGTDSRGSLPPRCSIPHHPIGPGSGIIRMECTAYIDKRIRYDPLALVRPLQAPMPGSRRRAF